MRFDFDTAHSRLVHEDGTRYTHREMALYFGVKQSQVTAWSCRGLNWKQADFVACRMGTLAGMLWPAWDAHVDHVCKVPESDRFPAVSFG